MAVLQRILLPAFVIGIAALFYEVQGAPTETALRIVGGADLTAEESSRVKRQGGGGCGCGCGCCCKPRCCCTTCRTCCCTRCCTTCCQPCCCGCGGGGGGGGCGGGCCGGGGGGGCGCCGCGGGGGGGGGGCGCCGGCGGGGRKRRSLDNLRIQLSARKSAERRGKEFAESEKPREKRNIMCQRFCAVPPHIDHRNIGGYYGDY